MDPQDYLVEYAAPESFPDYLEEGKWRTCQRCRLCETRYEDTGPVFGDGNLNSRILFVGIAPGATEEEQGKPFIGRSGTLLENLMGLLGIKRNDVWMTNIVMCRPLSFDGKENNRDPIKEEIDACKQRLLDEIYYVDPLVIVALGKLPAQALGGSSITPTSHRGRFVDIKIPSRVTPKEPLIYPMLVTWHPSYILRTYGDDVEPLADYVERFIGRLPYTNAPERQVIWDLLLAYSSALDAYLREQGEPVEETLTDLANIVS